MGNDRENNKNIIKKNITQIIEVVLFVFILVISLITLASTVKYSNLSFLRYRFYIMRSDANPEIAKNGDFVISKRVKIGEIKEGDYIVYGDGEYYYCDEVVEMKNNGNVIKTVIAEKNGIQYQFSETQINSKVVKVIPEKGNIISFLRSVLGMVLYAAVVICVFILLRFLLINKKTEEKIKNTSEEIQQDKTKKTK